MAAGAPRGGRHARAAHHRGGLGTSWACRRAPLIKSLVYMAGRQAGHGAGAGRPRAAREQAGPLPEGRGAAGPSRRGAGGHGGGGRVRRAGGPGRRAGLRIVADETPATRTVPAARASTRRAPTSRTPTCVGVVVGPRLPGRSTPTCARPQAGDGCPECGEPLVVEQVIEVGNIFKLGTKYSEPLGATVLDEAGRRAPIVMGSYGIGPARIAAAAVEQSNDERGIVWPKAIAPFDVHLVQVQAKDEAQTRGGRAPVRRALTAEGWDVLWDDRDERPGRQVRRRRADRLPGAGHGGQEGRRRGGRGGAAGRGPARRCLRGVRRGQCATAGRPLRACGRPPR